MEKILIIKFNYHFLRFINFINYFKDIKIFKEKNYYILKLFFIGFHHLNQLIIMTSKINVE